MTKRPEFLPFLLAFGALVAITTLALLGDTIPAVLTTVLYAAGFGGAAVLHPTSNPQPDPAPTAPADLP